MTSGLTRREFTLRLLQRSVSEFIDDRCGQLAAAIAYHVLFSLFPLAIVLAGASSLVLHATGARAQLVHTIVGQLPLSSGGSRQITRLLLGATSGTAGLGLLGILGLVYSASGVMAALRTALNQAWDVRDGRPYLKGKLIDVGLVLVVSVFGLISLGATVVAHIAGAGDLPGWVSWGAGVAVPGVMAFTVLLFLYRVIPATEVRLGDVWPAALLGAVLLVALQNAFAVYVANFGHYNAIYGSLGAVIAFMFFVYLASQLLLLGAEMASEWPRVAREAARERSPGVPLSRQLKRALVSLWVRNQQSPRP